MNPFYANNFFNESINNPIKNVISIPLLFIPVCGGNSSISSSPPLPISVLIILNPS